MNIIETILLAIIVEVVASIVAHPIVEYIAAHMRNRSARNTVRREPVPWSLDWSEWLFFIAIMTGLTGAATISLGIGRVVFGFLNPDSWHLPAALVAWVLYLILAFIVGYIGLQWLHITRDGLLRLRLRDRVFAGAFLAKVMIFILCLGWALVRLPDSLYLPLLASYLLFVAADAVAFIVILLID